MKRSVSGDVSKRRTHSTDELPDDVDYSTARLIEFTMDEEVGRYGFLLSERNVENE